jgi:hypothetical protein
LLGGLDSLVELAKRNDNDLRRPLGIAHSRSHNSLAT